MENEIYEGVPAIADDTLLEIARMAESRIEAVIKIKQLALKVTNPSDWTDQQGKPYIQASGSEKIANLFNISISFLTSEPIYQEDPDGHYTYIFSGRFSMGGRSIEVEGSRSSRDPFFKQNLYEKDEKGVNVLKREKKIEERDNKRDVRMAAYTNLLGNGITRLLGIRNLTWNDLEVFAGIEKEQVGRVEYKTKGDKPPLQQPGKKSEATPEGNTVTIGIKDVTSKSGEKNGKPYTIYTILDEGGFKYGTFDKALADLASCAQTEGTKVNIKFTEGKYGRNITTLTAVERNPGEDIE